MVDLRHWMIIRELSKHQNVHSTRSYFLLYFWFLDSYYFWQRITDKYSFRLLKVRRHSLLIEFFTLERMLCQKVPLGELRRRWEIERLLDFMYVVPGVLKISRFYFFNSLFISPFLTSVVTADDLHRFSLYKWSTEIVCWKTCSVVCAPACTFSMEYIRICSPLHFFLFFSMLQIKNNSTEIL